MINHKAFLFQTKDKKPFVVVFVNNDDDLFCKAYGYDAFATREWTKVFSVNYITEWLRHNGSDYVKRLPLRKDEEFSDSWVKQVWNWAKTAQSLKCV